MTCKCFRNCSVCLLKNVLAFPFPGSNALIVYGTASLESGSQSRIRSLPYSEKLCLYYVPVLNKAVGTMTSSSSSW